MILTFEPVTAYMSAPAVRAIKHFHFLWGDMLCCVMALQIMKPIGHVIAFGFEAVVLWLAFLLLG